MSGFTFNYIEMQSFFSSFFFFFFFFLYVTEKKILVTKNIYTFPRFEKNPESRLLAVPEFFHI